MSAPEFGQNPDFAAQIEVALNHARSINPLAPLNDDKSADRDIQSARPNLALLPADHIDSTLAPIDQDCIFTTDSRAYYHALLQSAQALIVRNSLDEATPNVSRINAAHRHELSHGKVIEEMGNSETFAHYAVRFAIGVDGLYRMYPHVMRSGPLRKVHDALSAAAPALLNPPMKLSWPDRDIIAEWGYDPDNLTELEAAALWVPPVPEGWTPSPTPQA